MALTAFTLFHVALSLIGIGTGIIALFGMLSNKYLVGWTRWFLITTIATSVTGYFFPVHKLLPSHIVGFISLIVLALAWFALYKHKLAGGWRLTYVITAVIALYLNIFVLVVQLFEKVPSLQALAPTQTEPPFKIAQSSVLIIFVILGFIAAKKFRPA